VPTIMSKKLLKPIGKEPLEDSLDTGWAPIDLDEPPSQLLSKPKGLLFYLGSSNPSNPTTNDQNWTYSSDFFTVREGNGTIKLDRYIGSITQENQEVLKVPKSLMTNHYPKYNDPLFNNLPPTRKKLLKKYFKK